MAAAALANQMARSSRERRERVDRPWAHPAPADMHALSKLSRYCMGRGIWNLEQAGAVLCNEEARGIDLQIAPVLSG